MPNVIIAGAGKIGSTIAILLAQKSDYQVTLIDSQLDYANRLLKHFQCKNLQTQKLDITDHSALAKLVDKTNSEAIVSSLPFFLNPKIVDLAKQKSIAYFDLTEDRESVAYIDRAAKDSDTIFVPQCGLAPGFINIIANDLIQQFERVEDVKLRCGALPANSSNALQYCLTWSTEGLINEYGNPCEAIIDNEKVLLSPLENAEILQVDGLSYEVFNTSGGIGSLADTYHGKVKNLTYKSIRYPGHREKMHFLMQGLKLNHDRETLKKILTNAIPTTAHDVVIIYVAVAGYEDGVFTQKPYINKFYPREINNQRFAAIQMTTATSACVAIDTILSNKARYSGRVRQEDFVFCDYLQNRFGEYLDKDSLCKGPL